MSEATESTQMAGDETHVVPQRYRFLPEPVQLEDTIATQDPEPPPDPSGGGDPERDFMLRYAAG